MSRLADVDVAVQEWAMAALRTEQMAAALGVQLSEVPSRLWDSVPPEGEPEPYVEMTPAGFRDVGGVEMVEVMATGELTVKVVGKAEAYDSFRPVAAAIHAALHGVTSVPLAGGGLLLSSRRVRTVAYPEHVQGVEYRHLGSTYQINAQ